MDKGHGSDPSLAGKLVVLIGGAGFLGSHWRRSCCAAGRALRIAERHPEKAFRLRPLADSGRSSSRAATSGTGSSVAAAMQGRTRRVYLVGTFARDQRALQADGAASPPRRGGAEGRRVRVRLGDRRRSRIRQRLRRDARARRSGVLAAFPAATIVRPAVLFGEDDRFVNMFAGLIAQLPVLPVFGPMARCRPLFVDDAAEAIAARSPTRPSTAARPTSSPGPKR
jgi:NADH dehydrogenase